MKKRPYIGHALEARFFDSSLGALTTEAQLRGVFGLLQESVSPDPSLASALWLVATGERESSYLYPVFDDNGPTAAALAVIREDNKEKKAVQSFTIWNGEEERTKGASISCRFGREDGRSSSLTFSMRSAPESFRLGVAANGIAMLVATIRIYNPIYCSLAPEQYAPVFKDRPGVGWMLYLPRILTVKEVPEARALVPVENADKLQIGTIIVSVTDEPFSDVNPEHVKIANAIEIRLVDQDLLPRFADL